MADEERKKLVWIVKKGLFRLSVDRLFQLAHDIPQTRGQDPAKLNKDSEEDCIEYVCAYMDSDSLLDLEDKGISQLLFLKDMVYERINEQNQMGNSDTDREDVSVPDATLLLQPSPSVAHVTTQAVGAHSETSAADLASQAASLDSQVHKLISNYGMLCQQLKQGSVTLTSPMTNLQLDDVSNQFEGQQTVQPPHPYTYHQPSSTAESMIALRDLPLLQRKEFKIHGGQIGDKSSEISYSNICKQIDQGLREKHTEDEIIRSVFRIIKPGNFKDMLSNKDDMTIAELKSFLQSHLGEKSSTELFQELMNAKQHEQETPQQFLYRMMGLKQSVIFTSRQTDSDIKYEPRTAQNVFLRTVYQGLSEKYDDIRRELRPLLADPTVTDDALLRQVTKTTSEESERKRRLGRSTRPKMAYAYSSEVSSDTSKENTNTDTKAKDELIHQLSAQVQALTQAVSSLQSNVATATRSQASEPQSQCACQCSNKQSRPLRKEKPRCCSNCIASNQTNCSHCFVCGEEGHRAVGCLKRSKQSGNVNRSWQGDNLWPAVTISPS